MRAQGVPIWPGRGTAVRLVLLALTGLCVVGSHAYAQTGMAEPYLFGDWGGTRTRLQDQGVRFDFQYVSDTLWGFKSEQKPFTMWNRFRVGVESREDLKIPRLDEDRDEAVARAVACRGAVLALKALLALGLGDTRGGVVGRTTRQIGPSMARKNSPKRNGPPLTAVLDMMCT